MTILNRDDAAGFRLNTLTNHHQYSNPVVQGKEILTTYTDYVNPYPSVLQTTSYNFSETGTSPELCAGVVKAQTLTKCHAQHAAELNMLSEQAELKTMFFDHEGCPKIIDCICMDGASDEGPSHVEVQYWWAERHLFEPKSVTLVTTRSSGSSYLNRVELQNGCLSLAHSNLFLSSTIHLSPMSSDTAKLDNDFLCKNLSTAIDVIIQRCDGAPCCNTELRLNTGTQFEKEKRASLPVYLR